MAKNVKNKILKKLKAKIGGDRNIQLPKQSIEFEEVDARTLRMTFTERKYIEGYDTRDKENKEKHVNYNMQKDSVCFEAWAVIIKTYCSEYEKIILAVDNVTGLYQEWLKPEKENKKKPKNGHVGRFFYRAIRFREQYAWFALDTDLETEVNAFQKEWLTNKTLYNNIPKGEPDSSEKENDTENKIDENYFEKQLSESDKLYKVLTGVEELKSDESNKIYRQLPVGLFGEERNIEDNFICKEAKTVNTVFTGRKSAIDMWTYYEDTIYPMELKYEQEMVGMITELFFYANFLWDLIWENGDFVMNLPKNREWKAANVRGYDKLKDGSFVKINAVFLADSYHPLITAEVIKTLNDIATEERLVPISYTKCWYEVDEQNNIKDIQLV